MSRTPIAVVAGIVFVLVYIAVAISLPDLFGRLYWLIEAIYLGAAVVVWVFPVRWLRL